MIIRECRFQREAGHNTIAVIGDSHAGHLYSGLTTQTKSYEGVIVFPAGCAIPLIGLHSAISPAEIKQLPHRIYTEQLLSEGFNYILTHKNIKKVVLSHHTQCSWHDVKSMLSLITRIMVRIFKSARQLLLNALCPYQIFYHHKTKKIVQKKLLNEWTEKK